MRESYVSLLLASLCVLTSTQVCAQIPVIPGASGFGITTPAGRGGEVIFVTNLDAQGPGSLKACIDAEVPRVCVFEVSGVIFLDGDGITIRNPYITIAGQTAPPPGIMLRNGGLKVAGSDVLIQHIAIRVGDDPGLESPSNADALRIETGVGVAENVVIDHVSLSWAIDETVSSYAGANNVTIRRSIISEGLHDSLHQDGPHSKGALIGRSKSNISFIGNLFASNAERNPRVLLPDFVFANNVIYNYMTGGTDMAIPEDGTAIRHSVVGNLYIPGPDTRAILPMGVRTNSTSPSNESKIYLSDNTWVGHSISDQWDLVSLKLPFDPAADVPPSWPDGLKVVSSNSVTGDNILDLVLQNAGSRPADRDSVDRRIIAGVRDGSGRIINCVSSDGSTRCNRNAGGWPEYPSGRRSLTLPNNPSGDSDGDGYTNLEEWLHKLAADVENGDVDNTEEKTVRPMPPEILTAE